MGHPRGRAGRGRPRTQSELSPMHMPSLPLTRDLVLIGGGHTHALLLRKWGMNPLPGARVTVINPGPTAPYSGMLPGYVAGHYDRAELDIDLIRLARFADARVILGAADGIDTEARMIHVPNQPPVAFDVASINVGITSNMPALPGFGDHAVPAKPLGPFAARWGRYLAGEGTASVAVIGGGVAGAELVMAMAHALRAKGRAAQVALIDNADILNATRAQNGGNDPARHGRAGYRSDRKRNNLGHHAERRRSGGWATHPCRIRHRGRRCPALRLAGWDGTNARRWLRVCERASAIQRPGDLRGWRLRPSYRQPTTQSRRLCGARGAGSVRQSARGLGGRENAALRPAEDYLKLISLGRKSALAERLGTSFSGRLMWTWKNHIDQGFMNRFRDLPRMSPPALPKAYAGGLREALGDKPMCGGCGAKVGRGALRSALQDLPLPRRDDVSPLPGDDAALLTTGGVRQVMTSDHLRGFVLDPALMTRIAAIHALGDIWAMGAAPQAATATVILPRMSPDLQRRTMSEIMTTASDVIRQAGAEIVGGHSSMGDEMTIGFTLTGLCDHDPITLSGGQPGDALILTKPLGSGVLMAAEMAGQADGAWVAEAYHQMVQPQGVASGILVGAHAMTDVTGFGLAGHLQGICAASGCGALVNPGAVPLMTGAAELSEMGIRSTIFEDNRMIVPELPVGGAADLLFDPQTAGGLLAAVGATQAQILLEQLLKAGYPAAIIGHLTDAPGLRLQN